ncbi:MAG TPA: zinc-ribbon domain-containing protein [Methanoregula sp.]|nr:zinc-ribbon domain-containing protein [Methanoregula sp.]
MKDSQGKIIYTYDGRNRLSAVRYENGVLVTYRYDPAGNMVDCKVSPPNEPVVADSSHPPSPQPPKTTVIKPVCPGCGTTINPGTKFCGDCGTPVHVPAAVATPQTTSFCPSCGNPLIAGIKFCGSCGAKIT